MDCSTSGFPVPHHLPEFAQVQVHWVGDAIQLRYPFSPPSPFTLSLSYHQGLFQWVSFHIKWPKYWSFSFSISPSNEYSRLISFRIDWFDLLAVLGTLKILLQHHSLKASILQHSVFFMFQLGIIQFSSVAQSCLTLCDPMNCSMPGLPVHHQLPEFTQTHVHWVCDAIQPSHPLSSPSPPALNLSQHQGLFKWVSLSHQVAKG